MSKYDDLRRQREVKLAAKAKPEPKRSVVSTKSDESVVSTECPVCARRREAKRLAMAKWRSKRP
jgi:hypothetical protein